MQRWRRGEGSVGSAGYTGGGEHPGRFRPDPFTESLPLRDQAVTLQMRHAVGTPRRSLAVSPPPHDEIRPSTAMRLSSPTCRHRHSHRGHQPAVAQPEHHRPGMRTARSPELPLPASLPGSPPCCRPGSLPAFGPVLPPGSDPEPWPRAFPGPLSERVPESWPGPFPEPLPGPAPEPRPGAFPRSWPCSLPGSFPGAVPESLPAPLAGAWPGSWPEPGTFPGTLPGS